MPESNPRNCGYRWRTHHLGTDSESAPITVDQNRIRSNERSVIDLSPIMRNTHRRRRRDKTVELRRVSGVYMNSQLAHDDCRRIRRCERSRRP